MITITDEIVLDEAEIHEEFVRSAGPGGQNVNKVATAVQLRFDAAASPALTDEVRARLAGLAGRRMTEAGELVITSRRHRTQAANREAALAQLVELVRRAAQPPKARRPTRPGAVARARRLEQKRQRSAVKQTRRLRPAQEE